MQNQTGLRVEWMADRENQAACLSNNFTDMGELLLYREAKLPLGDDFEDYSTPFSRSLIRNELLLAEKKLNQMLWGAQNHQNGIIFWSF